MALSPTQEHSMSCYRVQSQESWEDEDLGCHAA